MVRSTDQLSTAALITTPTEQVQRITERILAFRKKHQTLSLHAALQQGLQSIRGRAIDGQASVQKRRPFPWLQSRAEQFLRREGQPPDHRPKPEQIFYVVEPCRFTVTGHHHGAKCLTEHLSCNGFLGHGNHPSRLVFDFELLMRGHRWYRSRLALHPIGNIQPHQVLRPVRKVHRSQAVVLESILCMSRPRRVFPYPVITLQALVQASQYRLLTLQPVLRQLLQGNHAVLDQVL